MRVDRRLQAQLSVPAEVFYVEAPTIPIGVTVVAYRRSRVRRRLPRGLSRLLGAPAR